MDCSKKRSNKIVRGTIVVLVFVCVGTGCRKGPSDHADTVPAISSNTQYGFLFGRRYQTKMPLYLFSFSRNPDYLYMGGNGFGPKALPVCVSEKNIGRIYGGVQDQGLGAISILDVAPAGSILVISGETHDVTPLSGIHGSGGCPIGFVCRLTYGGKASEVFSEFIQSHSRVAGNAPNEQINIAAAATIQ